MDFSWKPHAYRVNMLVDVKDILEKQGWKSLETMVAGSVIASS